MIIMDINRETDDSPSKKESNISSASSDALTHQNDIETILFSSYEKEHKEDNVLSSSSSNEVVDILKQQEWHIDDKNYHSDPAFSYSLLSSYEKSPIYTASAHLNRFSQIEKESDGMFFGSLVDDLIFPRKEEQLPHPNIFLKHITKEKTSDKSKPPIYEKTDFVGGHYIIDDDESLLTKIQKAYLLTLYKMSKDDDYTNISENMKLRAATINNPYPRIKQASLEKRLSGAEELILGYRRVIAADKLEHLGYTFITREEYYRARQAAYSILSWIRNHSKKSFIYVGQWKFKSNILIGEMNPQIKIMPDIILIDPDDKTVTLIDVKTMTQDTNLFLKNFLSFRYDIQARLYHYIFSKVIKNTSYMLNDSFLFVASGGDCHKASAFSFAVPSNITSSTSYHNSMILRSPLIILHEMLETERQLSLTKKNSVFPLDMFLKPLQDDN